MNDSSVADAAGDAPTDTSKDAPVDAGPPPCGAPGEDCCMAPLAPCDDGLSCSTGTKKCLVSEAWAVGKYTTVTAGPKFITEFVTAHYDGASWTLGQPVVDVNAGFTPYDPVDIYEVGTNVRVISNENDIGHMYWWSGASWQECKPGNSCVGPVQSTYVWALTSVTNSGSLEYWLAGSNTMYRCASGASSCTSVTMGIPGTWGSGAFAGLTAQDLWYSQFDHVLHYDGTTWSSASVADAYTIGQVAANDAWVGQKQLRHWDGKTWSSAFLVGGSQTPGTIFSIAGSGPSDVHAVGYDASMQGGATFAAHYDGTAWAMAKVPSGMTTTTKVWAPSPIDAFMVGSKSPLANTGVIAHWDGTAWTEMTSPSVTYPGETQPGGLEWISVTGQARPRAK